MDDRATIDYETRSACSIKVSGSWKYSQHPTTEVLCLAFRLPYWREGRVDLWHPAFPHLGIEEADCSSLYHGLFEWVEDGGLVEAHNSWFERGIWTNISAPQLGWPMVAPAQWRCSAAKAAAHALPRSLDDACAALGLTIRKDAAGHKVMMKMNKPRKPRKAERERSASTGIPLPLLWWEDAGLLAQLFAYCQQDIRAEHALSCALPDLSQEETDLYGLDQEINERGFRLDPSAIATALRLIASETGRLNGELSTLTGGRVSKATQRAQMLKWFESEGLYLDDTQAATLDAYLAPECHVSMSAAARRALGIMRALGRSSTAKYRAMADHLCTDERVHGSMLYHGASTGRWTGSGIQPHNFPKGQVKGHSMEDIWTYLATL